MYLFACMFDSAAALLFLLLYLHLDTVSLHVKRRMNISTEKKCSDKRSFGRLLKTWIFLREGSLVWWPSYSAMWIDLLLQSIEADVAIGLYVELPWVFFVFPFHPFLFLLPTACGLSGSLNVVQPLEGEVLSLLLRWFFWVTFSIFFPQALNLIK